MSDESGTQFEEPGEPKSTYISNNFLRAMERNDFVTIPLDNGAVYEIHVEKIKDEDDQ